jgi:glutathione S-transferase
LAGADEWEAAKCDEYVDACNDLFTGCFTSNLDYLVFSGTPHTILTAPYFLYLEWQKFYFEKDPAKKSELKQEFTKNHCAKFLSKMNTIQQENGGAFLVSKEMTWADITIAERLERLETTVDAGILSGYPNLRKMKDAVLGGPKIKEWIAKRPVE